MIWLNLTSFNFESDWVWQCSFFHHPAWESAYIHVSLCCLVCAPVASGAQHISFERYKRSQGAASRRARYTEHILVCTWIAKISTLRVHDVGVFYNSGGMDRWIYNVSGWLCARVYFSLVCVIVAACIDMTHTHTRTHRRSHSAFPPQQARISGDWCARERIYACVCVFIVSPERRELWLGFANIDGWHPHQHSPRALICISCT